MGYFCVEPFTSSRLEQDHTAEIKGVGGAIGRVEATSNGEATDILKVTIG